MEYKKKKKQQHWSMPETLKPDDDDGSKVMAIIVDAGWRASIQ